MQPIPDDKFSITKATAFAASFEKWTPASEALRPIVNAFVRNVRRATQMVLLPTRFVAYATARMSMEVKARQLLGVPSFQSGSEEIEERVSEEATRLMAELCANPHYQSKMEMVGEYNLKHLIHSVGEGSLEEGLSALLESMVMAGWAAFESMASDLWEVALNCGPKEWVFTQAIFAKRTSKGQQDKAVSMVEFGKYGFDVSSKMGTIFKRKSGFQSWEEISGAYKAVFGDEMLAIFNNPKHSKLPVMEAARHVIAHRAGIVGPSFLEAVADFTDWASCQEGQPLPLDGIAVSAFMDSAVSCGFEMLKWIDEKLPKEPCPMI